MKKYKFTKRKNTRLRDIIIAIVGLVIISFAIYYAISSLIKAVDQELAIEDNQINNFLTLQK